MSSPYVVSTAPKIGPRVLGKLGEPGSGEAIYQAQLQKAVETGSGLIGSKILGKLKSQRMSEASGPVVNHEAADALEPDAMPLPQLSVADALARIRQPDADVRALWAEEHTRLNGPRKTVLAELRMKGYME